MWPFTFLGQPQRGQLGINRGFLNLKTTPSNQEKSLPLPATQPVPQSCRPFVCQSGENFTCLPSASTIRHRQIVIISRHFRPPMVWMNVQMELSPPLFRRWEISEKHNWFRSHCPSRFFTTAPHEIGYGVCNHQPNRNTGTAY